MKCDRCGGNHVTNTQRQRCQQLPSSAELAAMLDDDNELTLTDFADSLGIGTTTLYRRLAPTHWTRDRLRKRGKRLHRARSNKGNGKKRRPRCECGVLVSKVGDACKWCAMEADGVRDYHVLLDVGYVKYTPEVV